MLYEEKIARPYTFDLDLDDEEVEIQKKLEDRHRRKEALDNPPVLVTEDEALKWKQQGYDSGYVEGTADGNKAGYQKGHVAGKTEGQHNAIQSIEQQISDTLVELSKKLDEGRAQFGILDERFEKSSISVAVKLLHLFAPIAARENALLEIEGVIDQTLRDLIHEPRLIIRVCESLRDPLSERIETLINTHGFDGKITVLGDQELVNADLVIQWQDGGIERTEKNIWVNLNDAISKFLGTVPTGSSDLDETVQSLVSDIKQDSAPDASFDIQPKAQPEIGPKIGPEIKPEVLPEVLPETSASADVLEAPEVSESYDTQPQPHNPDSGQEFSGPELGPESDQESGQESASPEFAGQEPQSAAKDPTSPVEEDHKVEATESPKMEDEITTNAPSEQSSQGQQDNELKPESSSSDEYDWDNEDTSDEQPSNRSDVAAAPLSSKTPENSGLETQSTPLEGPPLLQDDGLEDWTDTIDWDEQAK